MKDKKYYEILYSDYPDLVTIKQVKKMLGGICEITVRKLLWENLIKHYFVNRTYYIPKLWVIEYVLSDHYKEYQDKLKHQV